jgi:predicted dienelactone hydrolase
MKPFRIFVFTLLLAFGLPREGFCATNQVETIRADWLDAVRNRNVPVKIYLPAQATHPVPIIIFSHGLGGSRDGYGYLGEYWASHGYVSVHVQHLGSDSAVWLDSLDGGPMAAMHRAVANLRNAANRPLDVSFAIDRLTALNRDTNSPLHGRLDLTRIGVAGHSFGAFTTLAIAGQSFPFGGTNNSFLDPRVRAALPMSASVPMPGANLDEVYAPIRIPCLHMTGTRDDSPLGETMANQRRVPFDHSKNSDQFLLTLRDADHMAFVGLSGPLFGSDKAGTYQKLICQSSTAFWDAYLRGNALAKTWLTNDFQTVLGQDGTFEIKLLAKAKR